eukprot:8845082-Pyramimonas_sp.AAC.1
MCNEERSDLQEFRHRWESGTSDGGLWQCYTRECQDCFCKRPFTPGSLALPEELYDEDADESFTPHHVGIDTQTFEEKLAQHGPFR